MFFLCFFTPISSVSYRPPYLQLLRAYLGRAGWGPLPFRLEQCAELVEACEMSKHGPTAADWECHQGIQKWRRRHRLWWLLCLCGWSESWANFGTGSFVWGGWWCPEFVSFVVASLLLLLVFLVVFHLLFLFLFFVVFCLLIFLLLLLVLLFFSYCYCCLCSFSFLLVLVVVVAGEHDFESDSMMLAFLLSFSILFLFLLAHCYLVLLLPSFVERRHSLSPFCGKLKSNVNDGSWCVCCIFCIARSSFSCAASIWRLVKNNNGNSSQKQFFDRNRSTCERLAGWLLSLFRLCTKFSREGFLWKMLC